MVYWKLFNNDVAPWSGYEGQVVRITNGTAKKQVGLSGSPELRSIESTNYVGLARGAQTHQEHELRWSGSRSSDPYYVICECVQGPKQVSKQI